MDIIKHIEKKKIRLKTIESVTTNFLDRKIVKQVNFILVLVFSFVSIYILNRLHPLFADDWMYSLKMFPSSERISNLGNILQMQYAHYFVWGGRSVVHVIAQSLLLIGVPLADFVNSLAFVVFTLLIYKLVNKGNKLNPSLLLGINLLIYLFQPAFGSTVLWITGSANYLWGTGIIIAFITPFVNQARTPEMKDGCLKIVIFFFLGVIAGWTNENTSVALVCMLALLLVYYKTVNNAIPRWSIAGSIGALIGCVVMVSAPGNFKRYVMTLDQKQLHGSDLHIFLNRFVSSLSAFYFFALSFVFVFILAWILFQSYSNKDKQKVHFFAFLFFLGAIIATLAMSASPLFPNRASFGLNMFIVVATGFLYANIDSNSLFVKRLNLCLVAFGLLFFASEYTHAYQELSEASSIINARIDAVEKGKAQGIKDFVFHQSVKDPATRFFHYFELGVDSTNFGNKQFLRYYGIHSIKIE